MGEEVSCKEGVTMQIRLPRRAECRLIKDGKTIKTWYNRENYTYITTEPGVYRVEVYIQYYSRRRAWIFSNPIYVSQVIMEFNLKAPFQATGDQPEAIAKLVQGVRAGQRNQVLLGATGTGKTFTIASVITELQMPALVMAHNKTLAAQLYAEFREFFPENAVEYFVSYYDYYQPEAYVPRHDLYIEKESEINEEIERLRLAATTALMSRRDVIIVASVSCIYGIGNPEAYGRVVINLEIREDLPPQCTAAPARRRALPAQ